MSAQNTQSPSNRAGSTTKNGVVERVFCGKQFFRLWSAQFITQVGEWVFFLVVTVKAAEVGQVAPEGAVALVLLSRLAPGLFFGEIAGVLADRWDRQKLLATCDIARAATVCLYPFATQVWHLIVLSLLLEAFTLFWIPAKEALVPNLVESHHLPKANTLSVIATYGTFPVALLLMFALDRNSNETTAGFLFDAVSFVISAGLIMSIKIPAKTRDTAKQAHTGHQHNPQVENDHQAQPEGKSFVLAELWEEYKDGWKLVFSDRTLRAVNLGLGTALIGGGMVVPLGPTYADKVLDAGNRGYYAILGGLGVGLVIGVVTLLKRAKELNYRRLFGIALVISGAALFSATTLSSLLTVVLAFGVLGAFVGILYILGFTILQSETDDEMRGRVFAAFYSLSRAGMLIAMVAAPAASLFFDKLIERTSTATIDLGFYTANISGVRITFWLAAVIILLAGVFASATISDTD